MKQVRIRNVYPMDYDHDGKHATGREVYDPHIDAWFTEYEGDYSCQFPVTDPEHDCDAEDDDDFDWE